MIDASELSSDVVRVGSVVNVKDEGSGKSLQYTIVGSTEANPGENRLSNESPVGKALLGNKRGDVVSVHAAERQGPRAEDHQDRRRQGVSDDLVAQRRRKLAALRDEGVEPFPHAFTGVRPIADVKAPFSELQPGEETEVRARVAGRLAARRGQGRAAFLDLVDRSGRIQLHARADVLGQESLDRLVSLDLGDLLGADGTVFRTRRGELSLKLEDWTLLAKSLRPPPEKHHGLTDVETRYRHRELDLMSNEESRELFIARARVISRDPPVPRRRGVRRGRDADPAADLRRRRWGGRSRPTTTSSTARCTCGSRPSCT